MSSKKKETLDPHWVMDKLERLVTQQESFLETLAKYHNRILTLECEKACLHSAVDTLKSRCDVLEDKLFPKPKGEPVA